MSNKKLYKETFDSIQMSEETFRKVMNMNENTQLTPKRTFKFHNVAVAAVATFALLFISSNAISYAATGNTLLETVTIYMNGNKVDDSQLKSYTDKNGNTHYEMELEKEDGSSGEIVVYDAASDMGYSVSLDSETDSNKATLNLTLIQGTVKQEGDQVILVIGDDQKKIEITDDFKDGTAKGTFTLDGIVYEYVVEGTIDNNTLNIQKQEK